MIQPKISIAKRFYAYQKERFPLVVLVISLFPAILSSEAIVAPKPAGIRIAAALIAALLYLLHIRIIDEHRDFSHDNAHHATRPIQIGLIFEKELERIDAAAIAGFFIIAIFFGWYSFILGALMMSYSYIAGKEFFVGEKIRRHFFFYNGVNIVQMFLMQLFVYAVFAGTIPLTILVGTHFLFTSIGTVISELVRKLKVPGDDGSGKDTYTWYLGFNNAIFIYVALLLLDSILFFRITALISPRATIWLLFPAGFLAIATLAALVHRIKKTHLTDQLMQLLFLVMYGVFNVAIYFLRAS